MQHGLKKKLFKFLAYFNITKDITNVNILNLLLLKLDKM